MSNKVQYDNPFDDIEPVDLDHIRSEDKWDWLVPVSIWDPEGYLERYRKGMIEAPTLTAMSRHALQSRTILVVSDWESRQEIRELAECMCPDVVAISEDKVGDDDLWTYNEILDSYTDQPVWGFLDNGEFQECVDEHKDTIDRKSVV